MKYTKEEHNVILMWRHLRRWEKLSIALLISSLAYGGLTKEGDRKSLSEIRRWLGLK